MKNIKNTICVTGLVLFAGLMAGCGTNKQIMSGAAPGQTAPGVQSPVQKARMVPLSHYLVQRNDCLWEIAAKPRIYGDSFEWPLLFKANRDAIQDPDLIYPRQDLKVQKGFSMEEINHAKQVASATPKFVPHTTPRETLPVDYF